MAVRAEGLTKRYGDTVVLDGVDLNLAPGRVLGLLGQNGAGKTTTVRVLTTLLRADSGRAEVAGFDVATQPGKVRASIGLVGQHAAVDEVLSGRDNLTMFGRLHGLRPRAARARAEELLERFRLVDAATRAVGKYSGGMRRRLDLAASLVCAPKVLFLDEPTTGLDPHSRAEVWEEVRALVAAGTSVLLTTQYLEEADQLADHVAVIAAGRVIAEGSPAALKADLGGDRIEVVLHEASELARAASLIATATGSEPLVDKDTRMIGALVSDRVQALTRTVTALHGAGVDVEDVTLRRPTLDEVFLRLTGKEAA
ncbi:ATP-binding cassette domain-containing protein [Allokutzneria sp. NRRL B-24872]|uniref:ATP-binding cassette domain-containing protein n=1 Tax=Allokutzneria sp. NRRL B-24872 TaxID=1137961 RepID=UPI000A3BFAC9|nr:ATP-binding cassette domain-containing protein [Allokutzneria sp. NRRL B-24872]